MTSSTLRRRARTFLSTPSARRATAAAAIHDRLAGDFYPRPPRGGRPYNGHPVIRKYIISIHALREEGDARFLEKMDLKGGISIHALREEGDPRCRSSAKSRRPISIHALREEGDPLDRLCNRHRKRFLSTPSARRATIPQTHLMVKRCYFYPRPPRGGRPHIYV